MKQTLKRTAMLLVLVIALMTCSLQTSAKVIYTGNLDVDTRIEKIIQKNTKKGMTKKQQLKACFVYLVQHMTYTHHRNGKTKVVITKADRAAMKKQIKELKAKKQIKFSKKFKKDFISARTLRGTCKGQSAMMGMIANHLGCPAGYVTGIFYGGHKVVGHWWSYLIYEGKRYECDVNAACVKRYRKSGGLKYFMQPANTRKWRKTHKPFKKHR